MCDDKSQVPFLVKDQDDGQSEGGWRQKDKVSDLEEGMDSFDLHDKHAQYLGLYNRVLLVQRNI